jgi:Hemerythrin HHE cation binding domain
MDKEADEALNLRDMYATHTLFRREFALAPRLVRDITEEDPRRARLVCEHLDLIMTLLMIHHQGQDTCDWPSPPEPGQPAVTRLAEPEHARLHQLTDHITTLIHQWRTSASTLHAKQLAAALEQLTLLINDRMARQEETILWPRTASLAS